MNIEDRDDRYMIGIRIIKTVNGVPYEGEVIKYCDQYYKIKYSDNDVEDLTHYQVTKYLKNKPLRQRQRKRNRKRSSLVQTNLWGQQLDSFECEYFGDFYPSRVRSNSIIVTYQNIGQQPQFSWEYKSLEMSKAFRDSKTSVALYTETGLNQ